MTSKVFKFTTIVSRHQFGKLHFSVVYLDPRLYEFLPLDEHPRLRVEAQIGGTRFEGAWQPAGGIWYLIVSKATLKKEGLAEGGPVQVSFRVIPQDRVSMPPELASELEADAEAAKVWESLTPGKRRGLAYLISEVKTAKTRAVRLARVVAMLHGDEPMPWGKK